MASFRHVFRRGHVFWWRRVLRLFDGRILDIRLSLKTSDRRRAHDRGAALTAGTGALVAMLEDRIKRGPDERLTEAELRAIAKAECEYQLARFCDQQREHPQHRDTFRAMNEAYIDYYDLLIQSGGRPDFIQGEEDRFLLAGMSAERLEQLKVVIDTHKEHPAISPRIVERHIRAHGFEPTKALYATVQRALYPAFRDAVVGAQQQLDEMFPSSGVESDAGQPAQDLHPSKGPEHAEVIVTPASGQPTFGDLCLMASDAKEVDGEWVRKTARQRRSLGHLIDLLLGKAPCSQFDQIKLAEFIRKRKLITEKLSPTNPKEAERILELVEQAPVAKAQRERGPHGKTINRDLTAIQAVVTWARAQGYSVPTLDTKALKVSKRTFEVRARDERKPTSLADLQKLFALPVFTGCLPHGGGKGRRILNRRFSPGPAIVHDAFYWVPLIVTYQGVRREEACKLMCSDFYIECEHPYFWIDFTETGRLKNVQSRRALAIHPELLRLGIEDYVREATARGYRELFPELRPTNAVETYGDQFFDLCWSHLRRHAALEPNTDIHGFRHAFGANLKKQRVNKEIRADMLGHGGETETDERYVEPSEIEAMLEEIMKLPNVTSHLVRAKLNVPQPIPFRERTKGNG